MVLQFILTSAEAYQLSANLIDSKIAEHPICCRRRFKKIAKRLSVPCVFVGFYLVFLI